MTYQTSMPASLISLWITMITDMYPKQVSLDFLLDILHHKHPKAMLLQIAQRQHLQRWMLSSHCLPGLKCTRRVSWCVWQGLRDVACKALDADVCLPQPLSPRVTTTSPASAGVVVVDVVVSAAPQSQAKIQHHSANQFHQASRRPPS